MTTAEIIAELVKLPKQMRDAAQRHEQLGLSVAEAALYDAIVQNDAAVLEMGDATLKKIAVDLVWGSSAASRSTGASRSPCAPRCGPRSGGCWRSTTTRRTGGQGRRARPRAGRARRGARVGT